MKLILGMVVGVVVLLGTSLAAEAQIIVDPIGPTCVESDDASSVYRATVTANYNFWFKLKVYHNDIVKHQSNTYCTNGGPSFCFSKTVPHTGWGMQECDVLKYRGRATISGGPYSGSYDEEDWFITVSAPDCCGISMNTVLEHDRRQWA